MASHSFDEARARGFAAMQFNFVVASNEAAVHLWTALGFATVGRVPGRSGTRIWGRSMPW